MANQIVMGEVYFVSLDPVIGNEMGGGKERPVVVVSLNWIHQNTGVVMIVPGTSNAKTFRSDVRVDPAPAKGLREVTYFKCHQARSIDQSRFRYPAVGRVSPGDLQRIQEELWELLGWIGPRLPRK